MTIKTLDDVAFVFADGVEAKYELGLSLNLHL